MPSRPSRIPVSDPRRTPSSAGPSTRTVVGATIAALAISAFVNHRLARKAERGNPRAGSFLNIDGVRLHYVERGSGEPLILLHGNGSMIQDFESRPRGIEGEADDQLQRITQTGPLPARGLIAAILG